MKAGETLEKQNAQDSPDGGDAGEGGILGNRADGDDNNQAPKYESWFRTN